MKIYVCKKCGNVVLKLEDKSEALVCCGDKMELVDANTTEAATEKHLPVYEINDGMINIKVGEVEHPMTDDHYISFIILASDDNYMIKKLKAGEKQKQVFLIVVNIIKSMLIVIYIVYGLLKLNNYEYLS